MTKVFEYGSFSAELNLTDYTHMEKIEEAADVFHEKYDKAMSEEKQSARMKGCILAISELFDSVFGDGAANAVLGKTTDFDEALSAEKALMDFIKKQGEETTKKYDAFLPNRTQRRTKK